MPSQVFKPRKNTSLQIDNLLYEVHAYFLCWCTVCKVSFIFDCLLVYTYFIPVQQNTEMDRVLPRSPTTTILLCHLSVVPNFRHSYKLEYNIVIHDIHRLITRRCLGAHIHKTVLLVREIISSRCTIIIYWHVYFQQSMFVKRPGI